MRYGNDSFSYSEEIMLNIPVVSSENEEKVLFAPSLHFD